MGDGLKMITTKKLLAILLAVTMALTFAPATTLAANVEIQAGAPASEVNTGDIVFFGIYPQSMYTGSTAGFPATPTNGDTYTDPATGQKYEFWSGHVTAARNGWFIYEPIEWRVLSNNNGELFLLAEKNLDVQQYHTSQSSVTWEGSTMRSRLNGYGSTANIANADYSGSGNNFIGKAFNSAEQAAIGATLVQNSNNPSFGTSGGNDTMDKIFLLSIAEANDAAYGFTNNGDRRAVNTGYLAAHNGMYAEGAVDFWWLRSPGSSNLRAAIVSDSGTIGLAGSDVSSGVYAVRPAFNLDMSSVIFTSGAAGGKTGVAGPDLSTAAAPTGAVKLTVEDSSLTLASVTQTAYDPATRTITFDYTGATPGRTLSAIVTDNNDDDSVTHYGKLVAITIADGSADVILPVGFDTTNDTLRIFVEQINGDKFTDFASARRILEILHAVTVNGGTGGGNYAAGTTVHITADAAPSGQQFKEWSITPAVSFVVGSLTTPDAEFTMPAQAVTITAVYEAIPTYLVTVNDGTGGGNYAADTTVHITVDAAPSGQQFKEWSITPAVSFVAGSLTTPDAEFTMPAQAVTATAVYEAIPTYLVTVTNGTGGGSYAADTTVHITADAAPSGQQFKEWSITPTVSFVVGSLTTPDAEFTMPAQAVTITAVYEATPPISRTGSSTGGAHTLTTSNPSGSFIGGNIYVKGSDTELIYLVNKTFSQFDNVRVGNTALTRNTHYTAVEGSTQITLHPVYLDTLNVGTHILRVNFRDGTYATATFTVVENAGVMDADKKDIITEDNVNENSQKQREGFVSRWLRWLFNLFKL